MRDIGDLHNTLSSISYENLLKSLLSKWKKDGDLVDFVEYFERQWVKSKFSNWQLFKVPVGFFMLEYLVCWFCWLEYFERNTSNVVLGTSTRSRSRPITGRDPKKNPIANTTRSRPELDDRVEIFWVATRMSVATRSKILDCFHQAVYPGKFSEKFLGRDPKSFLGRERSRVATGIFFWIATYYGSRPEFFSGSRPVFRCLGRDRIRSRPTGRWSPTLVKRTFSLSFKSES
jgi:hypothetical protein